MMRLSERIRAAAENIGLTAEQRQKIREMRHAPFAEKYQANQYTERRNLVQAGAQGHRLKRA